MPSVLSSIDPILSFAADSLNLATQVTANNIANYSTPGFTAQEVSFESSLQNAIAAGGPAPATAAVYSSPQAAAANGNNVDLPSEMTNLQSESLQYQSVVELLNQNLTMFHDALGAGS